MNLVDHKLSDWQRIPPVPADCAPKLVSIVPRIGQGPVVLLFGYNSTSKNWGIYECDKEGFKLVAVQPPVNSSIIWLANGGEPDIGKPLATWLPPARLLIDMGTPDALYIYDLRERLMKPVFWGGHRVAVCTNGAVAITQEHGFKCYVWFNDFGLGP
jgi:hypothetical protein